MNASPILIALPFLLLTSCDKQPVADASQAKPRSLQERAEARQAERVAASSEAIEPGKEYLRALQESHRLKDRAVVLERNLRSKGSNASMEVASANYRDGRAELTKAEAIDAEARARFETLAKKHEAKDLLAKFSSYRVELAKLATGMSEARLAESTALLNGEAIPESVVQARADLDAALNRSWEDFVGSN